MGELDGKVAVVTGGASGLGAATCRMLAAEGATVVCGDVNEERAAEMTKEFTSGPGRVIPMHLDVRDEESVRRVFDKALEQSGSVDILVNSAAVDYCMSVDELSADDWDHELDVNLRGPFLMAKQAYSIMKRQGKGSIVNICSTASKRTWPNASAYHASKWGLLGFSHALHTEARQNGVKVTALVSGGMRTPFLLDRFPDIDLSTLQDAANVANGVRFALIQPADAVIPEMTVIPMKETSWP